jgi:UDP-2,3-diacylglucosamine pyrophosphatase LpxH
MLQLDPSKTRYRSLWISDVHLGMKASRAACLADFLDHHDADILYLVGDIVDGLRLRRKWNWTPDCDRVVRAILDKTAAGTRVIYIPGNHDAFLRAYVGQTFCGVRIEADCDHITADGRLLHIRHGDDFDSEVRLAPLLAWIGHGTYHIATFLNIFLFALRRRLGLGYWSLSKFLKSKSRNAEQYVRAYEDAMLRMAEEKKAAGIVTGHIHQPGTFTRNGIQYFNTGDWVDHCSLLAEYRDGRLELLTWDERAITQRKSEPTPMACFEANPVPNLRAPMRSKG